MKYQAAKSALLQATGMRDLPVARQLTDAPDAKRLAYQLIHFSQGETAKKGLRSGLGATLGKIGVDLPQIPKQPSPRYELIFAALTFYAILCGAYAFLAPHVAPWIKDSHFVRVVLNLVGQGLPNKGIARRLGISENTAKFHVASLCGKLGASSRTEAVTIAARRGLILL